MNQPLHRAASAPRTLFTVDGAQTNSLRKRFIRINDPIERVGKKPTSLEVNASHSLGLHESRENGEQCLFGREEEVVQDRNNRSEREDLVVHCEAEVMEETLRKTLTSLHRLHDRLQQEVHIQRRASLRAYAEELAQESKGHTPPSLRPLTTKYAPHNGKLSTSASDRTRSRSGRLEACERVATACRSSSTRGYTTSSASPAYGWVLLRRINLRVEKLRILCGLAAEKMMLIEGSGEGANAVAVADQGASPKDFRFSRYEELGILSNLIRKATRSITDFERLEGQAIEVLSSLR